MAMMGRDDYAKTYSMIKSRKKKSLGVIYIEDITDKQFWQKIATHHEIKLYSEQGKTITGKSKLLQICSKHQLIAIDSDFDDLCPNHRPESAICHNKSTFILQTYAHGRENIVFSPDYLHEILNKKFQLYIDNHDNPILAIFEKLSEIWFEPYQKFLYLFDEQKCIHDDWILQIQFQTIGKQKYHESKECQDIAVKQDFSEYAQRLSDFDDKLTQKISNQADFKKFCEHLTVKGFNKETVWAFIRCHDFEEKFVLPLMKSIHENRKNKEFGYIVDKYTEREIGSRKGEIANHFNNQNDLLTILHHYFYDVHFNIAKTSNPFLNKTIQDYHHIIT